MKHIVSVLSSLDLSRCCPGAHFLPFCLGASDFLAIKVENGIIPVFHCSDDYSSKGTTERDT